jgi:hypothetical protein
MSSLSGRMNIAQVNIGFFTGFKKIKQRRISFVLGYKHIDEFYTKTTQKGVFSKLCVKIKERCYTDLLHFSTRKHNLVSFFGVGKYWILYWIQENKTATYFLRSRLFTYDIIIKNFNCN